MEKTKLKNHWAGKVMGVCCCVVSKNFLWTCFNKK